MRAVARRAARNDWDRALSNFRDAEQTLNAVASALDAAASVSAFDEADNAECRILTRRIAAARATVSNIHSCAGATSKWWESFSGLVPGLSAYHASGVIELFTPLTVGALDTTSAVFRVIAGQVTDFLNDVNQRRAA